MGLQKFPAKVIALYEGCRFFILITSHPVQSIALLPVSWYAAAPVLALPCVFAALLMYEPEHFFVYKNLYALTKGASAAGIVRYIIAAYNYMLKNTAVVTTYSSRLLTLMMFFSASVVILAVYVFSRKGSDS
jgi:hypothetical protein